MRTVTKAAVVGLGLFAGAGATVHTRYYNYYGTSYPYNGAPNTTEYLCLVSL